MRYILCLCICLLLNWVGCKPANQSQPAKTSLTHDSLPPVAIDEHISYHAVYGLYQHESNGQGFSSALEIKPMGNDLQFMLSVQQAGCNWQLQGTLAMMYHLQTEYAGFYDSPTCRLVFTFFLPAKEVRIETAGICVTLPPRCSLGGVYKLVEP